VHRNFLVAGNFDGWFNVIMRSMQSAGQQVLERGRVMSLLAQSQALTASARQDMIVEELSGALTGSGRAPKHARAGWVIPVTAIALAIGSMLATINWVLKAQLSLQQTALTIGLAVFVGTFISAAVLVRLIRCQVGLTDLSGNHSRGGMRL
jgi:hypothetical protein